MHIKRQTLILILILVILAGIGIGIAWTYYRYENASEDPRVTGARRMLQTYDELMREGRYEEGFLLLDSVEEIFSRIPCYAGSFEMGVVFNDRGSAWLTIALYKNGDSARKEELLSLAERSIRQSIRTYENWLQWIDSMPAEQLESWVEQCFPASDPVFGNVNHERMVRRRIEDLNLARIETKRRLSVVYSNLGIVQRHRLLQDSAILSYMTALKLWKLNPAAKNNLNTLLGRPTEDESIIKQLFPPDRRKPGN